MIKAKVIPCDFNIAFYKVMSEVKYDDYNNTDDGCIWYKNDNNNIFGKIKVAHYNKKKKCLWMYD